MERITSRKNPYIQHLRKLAADHAYRESCMEFLCDGEKFLQEALTFHAVITSVLWREEGKAFESLAAVTQYAAPGDLFDYASPLKNSPGPLFTVKRKNEEKANKLNTVIVLENVQDPGNVGTVIRTANAFSMDAVILTGNCADPYHPKTVRASMGAIFRQRIVETETDSLPELLREQGLRLYGAALEEGAKDVRTCSLKGAAVAVGSEGKGLSAELLSMCDEKIVIPMSPDSESLNAAVAAALLMWEMRR